MLVKVILVSGMRNGLGLTLNKRRITGKLLGAFTKSKESQEAQLNKGRNGVPQVHSCVAIDMMVSVPRFADSLGKDLMVSMLLLGFPRSRRI